MHYIQFEITLLCLNVLLLVWRTFDLAVLVLLFICKKHVQSLADVISRWPITTYFMYVCLSFDETCK